MKMLLKIQIVTFSLLMVFSISVSSAQEISSLKPSHSNSQTLTALFGRKNGGTISQADLMKSSELSLNASFDSLFQISSFRLTRVRKGEVPVELDNGNNGILTGEMKSLLENSLIGDKIYFEYIKCTAKDGTRLALGSLSFIIE